MSSATFVTLGLLAGVGVAVLFNQSLNEERYRQKLHSKKRTQRSQLEQQMHPLADIADLVSSGELQNAYCDLVETMPGPYQSTKYIYRLRTTNQLFTAYSPILDMNNRRS